MDELTGAAAVFARIRPAHLARELGLTRPTVHSWKKTNSIPAKWVHHVAQLTDLEPEVIKPEMFTPLEHTA